MEVSSGPLTRLAGISQSLVGAEGIHIAIGSVPPGSKSSPHTHINCETALYVLRGHGRFLIGEGLKESIEVGPGDYIFRTAGCPPLAYQRSHHGGLGDDRVQELSCRDRGVAHPVRG